MYGLTCKIAQMNSGQPQQFLISINQEFYTMNHIQFGPNSEREGFAKKKPMPNLQILCENYDNAIF